VVSNKQQINWEKVKEAIGKLGNGQFLAGSVSSKIYDVAFSWQEDKHIEQSNFVSIKSKLKS